MFSVYVITSHHANLSKMHKHWGSFLTHCKSKSTIVSTDIFLEILHSDIRPSEKHREFRRWGLQGGKSYLAMIATHTKCRSRSRKGSDSLVEPMNALAMWALNIHATTIMSSRRISIEKTCNSRVMWKVMATTGTYVTQMKYQEARNNKCNTHAEVAGGVGSCRSWF